MPISEEYSTAIHEAGHAVMSVFLKRRLFYVTINQDKNSLGHCLNSINYSIDKGKTKKDRAFRLERECIILLAGAFAQKIILREDVNTITDGSHSDLIEFIQLVRLYYTDEEKGNEYGSLIMNKVRNMIEETKQQIIAVADALMIHKTLSGEQIKNL